MVMMNHLLSVRSNTKVVKIKEQIKENNFEEKKLKKKKTRKSQNSKKLKFQIKVNHSEKKLNPDQFPEPEQTEDQTHKL